MLQQDNLSLKDYALFSCFMVGYMPMQRATHIYCSLPVFSNHDLKAILRIRVILTEPSLFTHMHIGTSQSSYM